MPKCAYCGCPGPFTREHLFPKWLYRRTKDYEQQFLLAKPDKFVDSEITIRDVCGSCNNGVIASLDAYALNLYDKYFGKFVKHDEIIDFTYEFDLLSRWLLKLSYNSARVHNSDQDELSKLANYILTGSGKPGRLVVFLRLIVPYRLRPEEEKGLPAPLQGLKELPPAFIRIGRAEDLAYSSPFSVCRMVGINSYYFYVVLPRERDISRQKWKETLKEFQSSCRGAERMHPMRSRMSIASSKVDGLDVAERHLMKYWSLYQSEEQQTKNR